MPAGCETRLRNIKPAPQPGPPLVVQLARLGDFLQTTPLLAALQARHGVSCDVAVTPAQASLAHACEYVGRVITVDLASLAALASPAAGPWPLRRALAAAHCAGLWELQPSRVYNLNLSRPAAILSSGWAGRIRGWRLGSDGHGLQGEPWSAFVMRLVADRRLTRLHLCDILASYADPPGPPLGRLNFRLTTALRRQARELLPAAGPLAVLQLGTNHDLRRWPLASFAALARGLLEQGARPVLVGTAAEAGLARRLLSTLGAAGGQVCNLMGRTSLPILAGVLAAADLVVSGDTGTLHLASAVGAPLLALFMGPAQVHETGPYGAGNLVLQARDHCGPCQEGEPACHGRPFCRGLISPQTVLTACLGLLAGEDADQAAAGLESAPGVHLLQARQDSFGQTYRPLRPGPLSQEQALALALREAGRMLMRSTYHPDEAGLVKELAGDYLSPDQTTAQALARRAGWARRLARAVEGGDAAAARRIAEAQAALAPLALLAGPDAPPRLGKACRLAARVLALGADKN